MKTTLYVLVSLATVLGFTGSLHRAHAQTVQGDILRGKGRFLEGAGWYELNSARGRNIDVDTWSKYNKEVQRLYRDYMIDRYKRMAYKKGLTVRQQAEVMRKFAEDQRRWRENPSPDDIASGNALNALAGDLADASIEPSSWWRAQVPLPTNLSLTSMAFKVADPRKAKLMQSTVAVDRMQVTDGWPLPFRRPEIEPECTAYKESVASVVAKCREGTQLEASDFDGLRDTVTALTRKIDTAIPTRDNERGQARDFVRRLDEATRIFAEQTYAERLIRDVSQHKATTVAELLGFMRQYRLMFADPGSSPEVEQMYEGLYGRLREQIVKLGFKPGQKFGGEPAVAPHVVATFTYNDHARSGRLFSNGHINAPDNPATWTMKDDVLTLRWPDRRAPGGAWVDTCKIAPDGKSWHGRNQLGKNLAGSLTSGPLR